MPFLLGRTKDDGKTWQYCEFAFATMKVLEAWLRVNPPPPGYVYSFVDMDELDALMKTSVH